MVNYKLVECNLSSIVSDLPGIDSGVDIEKYKPNVLKSGMKKGEFRDSLKLFNNVKNNTWGHIFKDVIQIDSSGNVFVNRSGGGILLKMYMSVDSPNTFKFFGMDVTDDLDVVIKINAGTILVGNLVKEIRDNVDIAMGSGAMTYLNSITKESIKDLVLDFKLGKFNAGDPKVVVKPLEDIKVDDTNSTMSIIRSFLLDIHKSTKDITGNVGGVSGTQGLCVGIYSAFNSIINKYTIMKECVGMVELYFELLKGVEGTNTLNILKGITNTNGLPIECGYNLFKGSGGENIFDDVCNLSVGQTFVSECGDIVRGVSFRSTFGVEDVMITMGNYGAGTNIYTMSDKDLLAGSVLDMMAYKDEDLIIRGFDLQSEDKDVLISNVLKTYKQKFRDFHDEDVADSIIELLGGDNVEDVINVKQGYNEYAINKSAFVNSGRLIDKLTARVLKLFK